MKRLFIFAVLIAAISGCSGARGIYDSMDGGGASYNTASTNKTSESRPIPADMAYAPAPASAPQDDAGEAYDYDYKTSTSELQGNPESGSSGTASNTNTLMFIKTANIDIRTDNFDNDTAEIKNITDTYGGYFESSNLYTPNQKQGQKRLRRYNATVRVPVANYESAKAAFEAIGRLYSSNETSKEVSAEYFNTQSRLETLKTEEERLLILIDEAIDMRVLIELEQRLSETRTQIELYEAQLLRLESLTSYSTIVLNLTETTEDEIIPPDDSFIARLTSGFKNSVSATLTFLQNVAVFLAYIAIPALLILLMFIIVRLVVKRPAAKKG